MTPRKRLKCFKQWAPFTTSSSYPLLYSNHGRAKSFAKSFTCCCTRFATVLGPFAVKVVTVSGAASQQCCSVSTSRNRAGDTARNAYSPVRFIVSKISLAMLGRRSTFILRTPAMTGK